MKIELPKSKASHIVAASVILYFLVFATLSVLKHESFHSTAFDLGIFDQNLWILSQGEYFYSTVHGYQPFADHVQPILLIPVLIYMFAPFPHILLVIQAGLLALGAIPIYLLAKKHLGERFGVGFAISYLLYPSLQYVNLFDFHTEAVLIPSLLFAIYFLDEKRYTAMLVSLFIAGSTKEYIPAAFVFIAAYLFIFHKKRKLAIGLGAISALWIYVNFAFVIGAHEIKPLGLYLDNFGGDGSLMERAMNVIVGLFTVGKLTYVALLMIPLVGLPFFAPEILMMAGPGFGIVLLNTNVTPASIVTHHTAFITPFVFMAGIFGAKRVLRKLKKSDPNRAVGALLFFSVGSFLLYGPFTLLYDFDTFNTGSRHVDVGREALSKIPDDATVSATEYGVPHLTQREDIYIFPSPFAGNGADPSMAPDDYFDLEPDIVLLDISREGVMVDHELLLREACNVAQSGEYGIIFDRDGWIVLERGAPVGNIESRLCQDE